MYVYEAKIPANYHTTKLINYAYTAFPLLPDYVIKNAFKKKDVKLNDVRCTLDTQTVANAQVKLYTPFKATLSVVYEDENILLIDKPVGISSEDDMRGGMHVLSVLQKERGKDIALCHRLDNQTSGILALAKNKQSEEALLEAFKARTVEKKYVCVVRGTMRPLEDVKEAYLVKDALHKKVRVVSHNVPDSKYIQTGYRVLQTGDNVSHLEITLYTGRTHQIRAHMAYLAHPVLGDDVYGDRAFNKKNKASRLYLCSNSLTFHTQGMLAYLNGKCFTIDNPFLT